VKPLRLALAIAVAALVGSPLEAAVLLPGSILVAGRDQLLLIDPERRPPEVVSSTTVGGGEPYEGIVDFDVARDGFVYAAVPGPAIHRIDPATGDRELVSSRDRGQGVDFVVAWAIAVARNGMLYVGDTVPYGPSAVLHRVLQVDPVSGDRTVLVQGVAYDPKAQTSYLAELEDGRILLVAGSASSTVQTGLWIGDPSTGALVFTREVSGVRALAPQRAADRAYAIVGSQIVDTNYELGALPDSRVLLSCTDEDPGLALAPRDLVEQFCATFEPIGMAMPAADCVWADWPADDDGRHPRDCRARRGHCVPM